jgi:hypothetical protein
MTTGEIAVALALIGVVAVGAVLVQWRATQHLDAAFPHWVSLALIGGMISLAGACCFAAAFLLGG